MKNLFSLFAFAALLAVGCKNIDQELVGKMQTDVTTLEGLATPMADLRKKLETLFNLVNAAPESVKNSENAEYGDLLTLTSAMNQKIQATSAEYDDILARLKTLAADYSAGKIKTEDAKKEYETLSISTRGLSDLLNHMNEIAGQSEAQYAKMSAGWKAAEEGAAK